MSISKALRKRLNCRVLLIEDDEVDRLAILRAISSGDQIYECDQVSRLDDAELQLKLKCYDIVVSDINLPDSNGLETITQLLSVVGKTPIVVLSGSNDEQLALQAIHFGAQDFISKQYIKDRSLIMRTLRHAIERHQLKLGLEEVRDREHFLARYDQCTALPNRLLFLDRLNQAVIKSQRERENFSLYFVDLDRFKEINDSLGHSAGDAVLRSIGQRLQDMFRESDTVARFGGDVFVILLHKTDRESDLQKIAEKIVDKVSLPIPYGRHICAVGASIGIACYPTDARTAQQLLKHADMAMYEAKSKGQNQFQLFSQALLDKKTFSSDLEKALREAVCSSDKSFKLHYQPRVDLSNNNVQSVEALIRWHHSTLGDIPPNKFIKLAEELGIVLQIDEWVFETLCQQITKWKGIDSALRISVNISGHSFNQAKFIGDIVKPLLKKYDIDGKYFEIEITESVLLEDTARLHEQLIELKNLGMTIALDDFGTGFSSLNYLNSLPIDTLKIDRSFVCDSTGTDSEQTLLKTIVSLGKALNMKIVVEGVETQSQLLYMKSLYCDEAQGFYFGRPSAEWEPTGKMSLDCTVKKLLG